MTPLLAPCPTCGRLYERLPNGDVIGHYAQVVIAGEPVDIWRHCPAPPVGHARRGAA